MSEVLAVVPTYVRSPSDLEVLEVALAPMRDSAPDLEVLVIDDGSPAPELVDDMRADSERLQFRFHRKEQNSGFSSTVNVGLAEALDRGMDALLVNADIEFRHPGWLERMVAQEAADGGPAQVVGARLLYPNGLIQHGGIFFSLLSRCFGHIHQYAPHDLPEAQYARTCPVTGALQLIRHECLTNIGLYDEDFKLGWEDVDYCLRVFMAGGTCVMQPAACAAHHESLFRGQANEKILEWQSRSWAHFLHKHHQTPLATFVPSII
jgi:GT2 family glycosyltransferase